MTLRERPMSPFFSAYAWRYTFFNPSVIHRATGITLAIGLIPLSYFFFSLAGGHRSYAVALAVFRLPVFKFFLVMWIWSFLFHFLNGIRHLSWDAGYGFEKNFARATGLAVTAGATILTIVCCLYVFRFARM
jgi:succinate dehydrogenase / fumarate reductase cytochrome b subunit